MTAVFRHELRMMFSSLTAYVYGMFSLLAVAIYMMYYNLSVGYANFEYALAGASFALLIMIPIITMRIIAEEKKQKTDQLLYSLPISTTQVVVGKFLAVFVTSVIPLVIVSVYPFILKNYGNLYLPGNATERVYLPEEVAETACFLLSDASGCISGQIIVCNNGKTINARWK